MDSDNLQWKKLEKLLNNCCGEWKSPTEKGFYSSTMPETPIVGNGDVGVATCSTSKYKKLCFSKSDFWAYNGSPVPIGEFQLDFGKNLKSFYEKQNISTATIETNLQFSNVNLSIDSFLCKNKNIFISKIQSNSNLAIELHLCAIAKNDNSDFNSCAKSVGNDLVLMRSTPNAFSQDVNSYTSKAAILTRVFNSIDLKTSGTAIDFTIKPYGEVYIVFAIAGGGKTFDFRGNQLGISPEDEAVALLSGFFDINSIKLLKNEHDQLWREYWLKSFIELDSSSKELLLIQKYYYGAQYIFGCMANENGVAPGLYGVWHTTDTPNWNSDYHLNYNFISTFYAAGSSNHYSLMKSAVNAIHEYEKVGEQYAESVEELRKINDNYVNKKIQDGSIDPQKGIVGGILFPVGIGPYAMTLDHGYHKQTLNAAFSATCLIDYWEYSSDDEYMKNHLYCYLKKCIKFYESWLEKDENDGYIIFAAYNEGSWAKNSSAELAMLKTVLKSAIKCSKILNDNIEERQKWQTILDSLAPQPTAIYHGKKVFSLAEKKFEDGNWVDMSEPIPRDGNALTLESVFPASEIGYFSSNEELMTAQNTISVFEKIGGWTQVNNFPKLFTFAARTRYPSSKLIKHFASSIKKQLAPNLRIVDTCHGAEKVGAAEAVNSMLLLKDKGIVKLFGNFPKNMSAGFYNLRIKGGFLISAEYDGKLQKITAVEIFSENGGSITIASVGDDFEIADANGKKISYRTGTIPNHSNESMFTFETNPKTNYKIIF